MGEKRMCPRWARGGAAAGVPPHPPPCHRRRIVFAYQQYRQDADNQIGRWETNYARLSPRHKALLHTQPPKFAAARQAAYQNHLFITALLSAFDEDGSEEGARPKLRLAAGGSGRLDRLLPAGSRNRGPGVGWAVVAQVSHASGSGWSCGVGGPGKGVGWVLGSWTLPPSATRPAGTACRRSAQPPAGRISSRQ